VLRCFDEENRRSVGKIELSSKEITEILNSRVLDDEEVTRQAVKNRLDDMEGDKLVKNEHGRSHLYSRSDDLDRLFREPEPATTPAGGSGGSHPPRTKETSGLFGRLFSTEKDREMAVPSLMILAILVGTIGFVALQALSAAYKIYNSSTIRDGSKVDIKALSRVSGSIVGAVALAGFSLSLGFLGAWVTWTMVSPVATVGFVLLWAVARVTEFKLYSTNASGVGA
jgi:hypothetical protein